MKNLSTKLLFGFLIGLVAFLMFNFVIVPNTEGATPPQETLTSEIITECTYAAGITGLVQIPGKGYMVWELASDITIKALETVMVKIQKKGVIHFIKYYRFSAIHDEPETVCENHGKHSLDEYANFLSIEALNNFLLPSHLATSCSQRDM